MKIKILKPLLMKILKKYGLNTDHSLITNNSLINAEFVCAYGNGLS